MKRFEREIEEALNHGDMWMVMRQLRHFAFFLEDQRFKRTVEIVDAFIKNGPERLLLSAEELVQWQVLVAKDISVATNLRQLYDEHVAFWDGYAQSKGGGDEA